MKTCYKISFLKTLNQSDNALILDSEGRDGYIIDYRSNKSFKIMCAFVFCIN